MFVIQIRSRRNFSFNKHPIIQYLFLLKTRLLLDICKTYKQVYYFAFNGSRLQAPFIFIASKFQITFICVRLCITIFKNQHNFEMKNYFLNSENRKLVFAITCLRLVNNIKNKELFLLQRKHSYVKHVFQSSCSK